jgi:hypothetical protein
MPVQRGSDESPVAVIRALNKRASAPAGSLQRFVSDSASGGGGKGRGRGSRRQLPLHSVSPMSLSSDGRGNREEMRDFPAVDKNGNDEDADAEGADEEVDDDVKDEEEAFQFVAFQSEDVELLESFALEIAATVHRHFTDTMLRRKATSAAAGGTGMSLAHALIFMCRMECACRGLL